MTEPSPNYDLVRHLLFDDLVSLRDSWNTHAELFGASPERVKMLNACGAWFFASLQRMLIQDTLLGIARLTDPLQSMGRDNMVLERLALDPELIARTEAAAEFMETLAAARSGAEPARVHRNKAIAHSDHATAIGPADELLPSLKRSQISEVLALLEKAFNIHGGATGGIGAEFGVSTLGGVLAVLRILEQSERWKRVKALEEGAT